jgi:hypothetical protein
LDWARECFRCSSGPNPEYGKNKTKQLYF